MGKRLEDIEAAVSELYKISSAASVQLEEEIAPLKSALVAATYKVDAVTTANAELQQKVSGLEKDLEKEKKKSLEYCTKLREVLGKRFDANEHRATLFQETLSKHDALVKELEGVTGRLSLVVSGLQQQRAPTRGS